MFRYFFFNGAVLRGSVADLESRFIVSDLNRGLDVNILVGNGAYLVSSPHSCRSTWLPHLADPACDFWTDHVAKRLHDEFCWHAVINYKRRFIIDMNRPLARAEDYRRLLRYYLFKFSETYKCVPVLFDIHSFNGGHEWIEGNKSDVVYIKHSFNHPLIERIFVKYWSKTKYRPLVVAGNESCDAPQCHEKCKFICKECKCNDIVVSNKDIAHCFLFEFSEDLIDKKKFMAVTVEFFRLLKREIDKRRRYFA